MRTSIKILSGLLLFCGYAMGQTAQPIYSSAAYSVYPDKIVQGRYTAKAISATELTSDYRSPANLYKSPVVEFKFSINGKDNELSAGVNHHFACISQLNETSVIIFGENTTD